jgi:hypothetical protein
VGGESRFLLCVGVIRRRRCVLGFGVRRDGEGRERLDQTTLQDQSEIKPQSEDRHRTIRRERGEAERAREREETSTFD